MTQDTEPSFPGGEALGEHYQMVAKLGEGGFSRVYRARQRSTGQDVAIKLLQLLRGNHAPPVDRQVARFQREARLCAHLHHPHIVRLIDAGQAGDTLLYSVFQFVPGDNLGELLARERVLALQEAIRLMVQVLDALHCAHRQGIIHRDLKPGNIMVSSTGLRRNAQVLDFGISTVTGDHGLSRERAQLTGTNELLGSPAYASPEQLRSEPVTVLSDFYTWGLILLETLSGECPMRGGSLSETLYKQLGPEPVPIPESLAGHPLEDLLRRVLVKDPARRQVSAAGLLQELEAIQGNPQGDVTPPWPAASGPPAAALSDWLQPTLDQIRTRDSGGSERRQLTALCCDLQVLGGDGTLNIEEWDSLLRDQMLVCMDTAQRFGGQVAGVLGDQVLIYFGYSQARENDPIRAARAALNLLDELEQRGGRQVDDSVLRVTARLGIHTGLVVVDDIASRAGSTSVISTTANVAVQLTNQAELGTILLSGATDTLLDERFIRDAQPSIRLPGFSQPLSVHRLQRERSADELAELGGEAAPPPMVGREHELARLEQLWSQTRDHMGHSVLILGEAGIGKTRLTQAFRETLQGQPCRWLECRCAEEHRNVALQPVVELLESLLRREGADPLAALERLLKRYGFELEQSLPLLAGLLALPLPGRYAEPQHPPERHRQMLFEVLEGLILELAQEQPTLLLVEDLHWVDPSTQELLGRLVNEAATEPLLVLGTGRPEFTPTWPPAKVAQLNLQRLDPQQARRLVARIAGERPLDEAVVAEIVRRTDGVSLFVEELTRMLLDSPWTEPVDGRTVSGTFKALQIPATLRGLLTAKLDKAGEAKSLAQLAAALGEEFGEGLLAAVAALDEAQLRQTLGRLRELDLIQRRRRRDRTWQFKHALIKDAAYDSMPRKTRVQVHRQVAAVIEQQFASLAEDHPEVPMRHHDAGENPAQALSYGHRAAMLALRRSANAEAVEYASQALGWLDSLGEAQARQDAELKLLSVLAAGLSILHGFSGPHLAQVMERTRGLLEGLGDDPRALPNYTILIGYLHVRAQRPDAKSLVEHYLAISERHEREDHLIIALPLLAQCLWVEGDYPAARPVLERAMSLYRTEQHRQHAYVFTMDTLVLDCITLSQIEWACGRLEQAWQQIDQALAHAEQLNHPSSIAMVRLYVLLLHQQNQDKETVARLGGELLGYCQQQGLASVQAYGAIVHGWATGQVDVCRQVIDTCLQMEIRLGMTYYRSLLAEVLFEQGQGGQALKVVTACLDDARQWGERYYLAPLYRLKGRLLAGDPGDAARDCFEQACRVADEQGARLYHVQATLELARLERDPGRAQALLSSSLQGFTGGSTAAPLVPALQFLRELEGRENVPSSTDSGD